jgi:DNA-binding transcriptional MocR family regulator
LLWIYRTMINLKLNYPSIPEEAAILKEFMLHQGWEGLLPFPKYQGKEEYLHIARHWLKITDTSSAIIECNSGNHSLNCILQVLKKEHQRIITEPFTYSIFRPIAQNHGFQLFPSAFDHEGLTPEGLEQTIKETKAKIIYLQPTIHNPTCIVMPLERRKRIAELAKQKDILIIEDDAYRFLHPNPPARFLDLIPENTFHIFSLSKPFNPLVKTSYLVFSDSFTKAITETIQFSCSGNSSLLSSLAAYLLSNSRLDKIIVQKQLRSREIQKEILPLLNGVNYHTFPNSFHLWLELPEHIKSRALERELAQQSIIVPNGMEYSVNNSLEGEQFTRIALGTEKDLNKLKKALTELMSLIAK